MKRLAIVTTHPIQYNAPLFRRLTGRKNLQVKVFYTWGESVLQQKYDPGFGRAIEWDLPLLEGYESEFLENIAKDKGSHHFRGINNPAIHKQIAEFAADSILLYGWSFKSHYSLLKNHDKKIKLLFRGDSTLIDEPKGFRLKKIMRRIFLRWLYRHIDIALYTGTRNKYYFLAHGLKEKQVMFAPHAIENERFAETAANREEAKQLRSQLNIPEDAVVFLFAGKFIDKKNPLLLLDAFIGAKPANANLIFAGNGAQEDELKRKALATTNINFLPFVNQSEMPALYQCCDVFILPSSGPGETWGLAINEAMAAGKAIIASDKCGAAIDLVKPGVNGYIFSYDCQPELVEGALRDCLIKLSDKGTAQRMGSESRKIIADWNIDAIAEAIEEAVVSLSLHTGQAGLSKAG